MKLSKDTIEHEIVPFLRGAIEREFCTKVILRQRTNMPLALLLSAIEQGWPLDMLKWIYEHCPVINNEHLSAACRTGNVEVVKWMAHYVNLDKKCVNSAACAPTLDVFWWIASQGVKMVCELQHLANHGSIEAIKKSRDAGSVLCANTFVNAAKGGHQALLEWLHQVQCPMSPQILSVSVSRGDLKQLEWLRNHGCPCSVEASYFALQSNRLDILNWLLSHGCPVNQTGLMKQIIKQGTVERLEEMRLYLPTWKPSHWDMMETYNRGYLPILQYLCRICSWEETVRTDVFTSIAWSVDEPGCMLEFITWFDKHCSLNRFVNDVIRYALWNQDVVILDWLKERNYHNEISFEKKLTQVLPAIKPIKAEVLDFLLPIDTDRAYLRKAASNGSLTIVRWMLENGMRYDEQTMALAVSSGNFALVDWLSKNGCPRSRKTVTSQIYITSNFMNEMEPELVQWLKDQNCFWDRSTEVLVIHSQWKMAQTLGFSFQVCIREHWCREQCEHYMVSGGTPSLELIKRAVSLGDIDFIQKTVEFGCPLDHPDVFFCAIKVGLLDNMKWLRARGCSWSNKAWKHAQKAGNKQVLEWLASEELSLTGFASIHSSWLKT